MAWIGTLVKNELYGGVGDPADFSLVRQLVTQLGATPLHAGEDQHAPIIRGRTFPFHLEVAAKPQILGFLADRFEQRGEDTLLLGTDIGKAERGYKE